MKAVHYGMGTHIIYVGLTRGENVAEMFYLQEVLFPAFNSSVKISILLLYHSLFGATRDRKFEITLRSLGALWLGLALVGTFTMIFQCWPIRLSWISNHAEQCLDLEKLILTLTIFSIPLNFATLIVPLPLIWKLHLTKRRKFVIGLLFVLGGG